MNKDKIKKALECCNVEVSCNYCPYHNEKWCIDTLSKDALNLITEQENEIERLKKENGYLLKACEEPFTFNTTQNKKYSVFNTVRKEFAERLKESAIRLSAIEVYHVCNLIDELLREYDKCGAEEKE